MNTQPNTPASRNEEAEGLSEVKTRLTQLMNAVSSTAYAYGEAYGSDSEYLDPAYNWKTLKVKSALALSEALAAIDALAAPGAAIDAGGQEVDRSAAVNLARNMLTVRDCKGITSYGVRVLCEAVMTMDAFLASRPEAPPASASPATVAQPVGWKLVPIMATDEMLVAGRSVDFETKGWSTNLPVSFIRQIYDAAVAASHSWAPAAQPCASQGCADASRYRFWRDAMLREDERMLSAMTVALPAEVGDTRRPTAEEWDAAIDATQAALSNGKKE